MATKLEKANERLAAQLTALRGRVKGADKGAGLRDFGGAVGAGLADLAMRERGIAPAPQAILGVIALAAPMFLPGKGAWSGARDALRAFGVGTVACATSRIGAAAMVAGS